MKILKVEEVKKTWRWMKGFYAKESHSFVDEDLDLAILVIGTQPRSVILLKICKMVLIALPKMMMNYLNDEKKFELLHLLALRLFISII